MGVSLLTDVSLSGNKFSGSIAHCEPGIESAYKKTQASYGC